MSQELSLWGVLFPPLLPMALVALLLGRLLAMVMSRTGFYRLVWHRALFDVSLFVALLAGINALSARVFGQ